MNEIISIIFILIFTYYIICTVYILLFTISSFFYHSQNEKRSSTDLKFAILIPAYHEDNVINECIEFINAQSYNKDRYDIYVVSDGMRNDTNRLICAKGANVFDVQFINSSKANALKYVSNKIEYCDYIIILDADNIIPHDYLERTNEYLNNNKCKALQTHRKAKRTSNKFSYIDAVFEEINNTIFRQGHVAINISSSLIGSGIALDYTWFINNIKNVSTIGEDKEIEELLLKQKHFINYSKEIFFLDEKTNTRNNISNQRKRWIATQMQLLAILLPNIYKAIKEKNIDYIIKTVETMILPKSILMASSVFFIIITAFIFPLLSHIWFVCFMLLLISFYIAIPKYLRNKRLIASLSIIPFFIFMMTTNLFKARSVKNDFIHTKHGNDNEH